MTEDHATATHAPPTITAITLDLTTGTLRFGDSEQEFAVLPLAGLGALIERALAVFDARPARSVAAASGTTAPTRPTAVDQAPTEPRGTQATMVVTGQLKTAPTAGRPDRRGKPTAWATFLAHEEGSEEAKPYLATFHRHTAALAIETLAAGDQLTVEGYHHPSTDPRRKDTLSVFNLVDYPGKPSRRNEG